jgi:hypothetical protein
MLVNEKYIVPVFIRDFEFRVKALLFRRAFAF